MDRGCDRRRRGAAPPVVVTPASGRAAAGHRTGAANAWSVIAADPARDLICVILTTRPRKQDDGFLLRRVSNAVQASVERMAVSRSAA